jgi:coupling of ubiquitin conjugation to ER degradation protein 1
MSTTDQTINLPQLILILVLGGLALRYFFFSTASGLPGAPRGSSSASSTSATRARDADVERIQQMFPQVPRRNIMWDLQRNGGNVVATTERILSGRGLEVVSSPPPPPSSSHPALPQKLIKDENPQPPQSFQPLLPVSASSTTPQAQPQAKPLPPDLITRYNLKERLSSSSGPGTGDDEAQPEGGRTPRRAWSANKAERQALLQKRRDEMILAARRKMEAKVAAEDPAVI